jgi:proline racemase
MRHDRSPCGAGASARLAVMLARDQIAEGETFVHESLIGAEFIGRIRGLATVGDRPAVLPTITGSAWITAFRQYVLDPSDPFPTGFRLGDLWAPS